MFFQLIAKLLRKETEKLEQNLLKEEKEIIDYEHQLNLHELALEKFLYDHYTEVSSTLNR